MAAIASIFNPSSTNPSGNPIQHLHKHTAQLLDIQVARVEQMDAHDVEYMLLSLTSPGPQGRSDPVEAAKVAREANDWLARSVAKNPARFGALASVSMHNTEEAAAEVRRAVNDLGMFGVIINDYQEVEAEGGDEGTGKKWYNTHEYQPFWKEVEQLGVPVYLHPRYPPNKELEPLGAGEADGKGEGPTRDVKVHKGRGEKGWWAQRKHLLGAAVQFHLDLSKHLYAICSGGVFDEFPGVQVVVGHLGEG